MPTPFPGMDPYLERRDRWHAVHTRLIVAIADTLGPQVRPRYHVDIALRTYIAFVTPPALVGVPDVLVMASSRDMNALLPAATQSSVAPHMVEIPMPEDIHERYVVVQDVATQEVITTIEILSLANKLTAEGRQAYTAKRQQVFGSQTNLVEIDLLRAGPPLPPFAAGSSAYRILIRPAARRPHAIAYTFSVRDPIPTIAIPLRPGDVEPTLPLNALLHELYDRAGYDRVIDYSHSPAPPLSAADRPWIRQRLSPHQEGPHTG